MRARRRAAQPGHRRRPRVERAAGRRLRVVGREPGTRPADRRDHADAGRTRSPITTCRPRPGHGTRPSKAHDVGGAILHAPVDAPSGLRGTFAIAASRAPGVTVTIRDRFDATGDAEVWADFAADGRLEPATDRRPSAAGEAIGAAVAATVELAPGERRSVRFALAWDLPVVEFGAGRRWCKRYTRDWGRTGARAFDLATHALERTPAWRAAIEAWQAPVLDVRRPARLVQGGALQRALLPRRRRDVLGGRRGRTAPSPTATTPAGSRCSSASTTRSTTRVDVDFYASFAILRLFPELEARGIRDLLAAIAGRRPGDRRRSRRPG